ncbi:MAG: hypothetical protein K0Q93_2229 [Nocardioidaceae bacterium]|nr:hypothetical protein [Nocardioidaceae bacterium]
MTATSARRRPFRVAAAVTGLLTVPLLATACADQGGDDGSSASSADSSGAESGGEGRPMIDPACPDGLTADDLTEGVDYPAADVDGDGEPDSISLGMVTGGGAECPAALVVTTATGTAAAAVTDLQAVPPKAFIPGGAAQVGDDQVIAAPVSWSLRGGGEVGLFTLVDGVLTPVEDGSGQPWTVVATVDDAGGMPQSIDCSDGGLTHVEMSSDGLGGPVHERVVHYTLDGAQLTKEGAASSTSDEAELARGLHIFASC